MYGMCAVLIKQFLFCTFLILSLYLLKDQRQQVTGGPKPFSNKTRNRKLEQQCFYVLQ